MYAFYSLVTAVGMILLSPYFLVRGLISGKYLDHVVERLGWRFPPELVVLNSSQDCGAVWIHAVSVGEVLVALPLAKRIKARYPQRRLVISTTTKTGQRLAFERKQAADAIFYFPLDWQGPVRRALRAVRPAAVIVVETEIWPNFLHVTRASNVPVIFVNGRLSERSFRGYQRAFAYSAGMLRGFLGRVLSDATLFLMQSELDGKRLLELGAEPNRVIVSGNMKYDLEQAPPTAFSNWLSAEIERSGRGPVIVAGSVVVGEESIVLEAFDRVRRRFPNALLVLAPRKPENFDAAAKVAENSGQKIARRSELLSGGVTDAHSNVVQGDPIGGALDETCGALLLDSVGELASVYALADAVFVGGSLVPTGGHNILEPAAFGKAPIFGPHMENFRQMAQAFLDARAAVQVHDAESLAAAWIELLEDTAKSGRMGAAALAQVERNRGATARVMDHIEKILDRPRSAA